MNTIDRYIDDDTWIRVKLRHPAEFCFIRVVDKQKNKFGEDIYEFNQINIERMSKGGVCYCDEATKNRILEQTETRSGYQIKLWEPVELLSTEEIFHIQ